LDEEPVPPAAFLVNASRIDQSAANDFVGFTSTSVSSSLLLMNR